MLKKIFGLFQTFDPQKSGKGVGLFTVKNQLLNIGAEIFVEAAKDVGTHFIIKL